jgi:hypothetical protein
MSQATDMLAAYIAAETAVLSNQEYRIGDRMFRKADLLVIQNGRQYWQRIVNSEAAVSAGGSDRGISVATFND